MSSNATSPKSLFPSLTSFLTFLLFSQFASQYSKNLVPHYSRSVVQRIPLYLTSLAVPESLSVVSLFLSTCVLPPQHPFFASLIVMLAWLDTTPNSFIALFSAYSKTSMRLSWLARISITAKKRCYNGLCKKYNDGGRNARSWLR